MGTTANTASASGKRQLDWKNLSLLTIFHLTAIFTVVYLAALHFSWWTVGFGFLWFALCGLSITAGYHRLFSHRTYKTGAPQRLFLLLFGAASVQNSCLDWCIDHRAHHIKTDHDGDPYNITKGFFWAHMGWILHKNPEPRDESLVPDLLADPLVRFQARFYYPLVVLMGFLVPFGVGWAWGDPLGAFLVAGVLRLVLQFHQTWAVNSMAHTVGSQNYTKKVTARDSLLTALFTLGEGYHNFHHKFQTDYRNGIRWFHFDPTKWILFLTSKVGLTWDLKRTPKAAIERARGEVKAENLRAAA